jgi:hypothetical protein
LQRVQHELFVEAIFPGIAAQIAHPSFLTNDIEQTIP